MKLRIEKVEKFAYQTGSARTRILGRNPETGNLHKCILDYDIKENPILEGQLWESVSEYKGLQVLGLLVEEHQYKSVRLYYYASLPWNQIKIGSIVQLYDETVAVKLGFNRLFYPAENISKDISQQNLIELNGDKQYFKYFTVLSPELIAEEEF